MTDKEPRSPADPRPNNRPYYVDPNCPICDTPLVLFDVLAGNTDKIWYDEWICPEHVNEGVIMDWPKNMTERIRGRLFEMDIDDSKAITLADNKADGGFEVKIHPQALVELQKMLEKTGVSINEIIERVEDDAAMQRFKEELEEN